MALQLGQPVPSAAAARDAAAEIEEQFRAGEQAWKASCPKPTEDGSCIEIRSGVHRPRALVVERDPALVAAARLHFSRVAKLWRRMGGREIPGARASASAQSGHAPSVHPRYAAIFGVRADQDQWESAGTAAAAAPSSDRARAARAAAGTAFYLAEAQWEAFLRIEPPFDPGQPRDGPAGDEAIRKGGRRWRRRMKAFVIRKMDQLVRTREMYLALLKMRQAPFEVASIARIGQLYSAFDDASAGDLLDAKAAAAFETCFDTAAKNARYDEWFRLCEHELTVLRPGEFPKANEFVPEANHAESGLAPIPLIR